MIQHNLRFARLLRLTAPLTAALGLVTAVAPVARAQTFTFTKLADTATSSPDGIVTYVGAPSISGNTVAFRAGYSGGNGIFTESANGGSLTGLVQSGQSVPSGTFVGTGDPHISGTNVTFVGAYQSTQIMQGLFAQSASGGAVATLAQQGDAAPTGTFNEFLAGGNDPSISGSTIAFFNEYNNGNNAGLFSQGTAGGPITALVQQGDSAPIGTFSSLGSPPSISGNTVAFVSDYNGRANSGLFTQSATGGAITDLAQSGDITTVGKLSDFQGVGIDGTTIAFEADGAGNKEGLFTQSASGGGVTALTQSGNLAPVGTFSDFASLSVSGNTIAFYADYNNFNNFGLFIENANGVGGYSSVIQDGDSLFGSTVTELEVDYGTFNSAGNIAFRYTLANGVEGAAVASQITGTSAAPEPGALALLMPFGLLASFSVVRRRQLSRRSRTRRVN